MRVQQASPSFALCVEDGGMEDLEARKVYQILPRTARPRELGKSGGGLYYFNRALQFITTPSSRGGWSSAARRK